MRVLFVAVGSLLLQIAYWVRYRGTDSFNAAFLYERDVQQDFFCAAFTLYMVCEGIFLVLKNRKFKSQQQALKALAHVEDVEEELEDASMQREQFQAEIQRAREELGFLSRRLLDVTAERDRLKEAVSKFSARDYSQRPLDAEITVSNYSSEQTASIRKDSEKQDLPPQAVAVPLSRSLRL